MKEGGTELRWRKADFSGIDVALLIYGWEIQDFYPEILKEIGRLVFLKSLNSTSQELMYGTHYSNLETLRHSWKHLLALFSNKPE